MPDVLPIHLKERTLPEQLRYLAGKLTDATASPGVVAVILQVIADEQDHPMPPDNAWLITPCEDCGAPTHEGRHLLQEGPTDAT